MTHEHRLIQHPVTEWSTFFECACGAVSILARIEERHRHLPAAIVDHAIRGQAQRWFATHLQREAEIEAAWARRHELRKVAAR